MEHIQRRPKRPTQDRRILRNDRQFASQVRQPDLRYIQAVDKNATFSRLYEAEERERQGAFARSCSPQDADFLSRFDVKG